MANRPTTLAIPPRENYIWNHSALLDILRLVIPEGHTSNGKNAQTKQWFCNRCPVKYHKVSAILNHYGAFHFYYLHFCGYCWRKYRYRKELDDHIAQHHNPTRPYPCGLCDKNYKQRPRLINHLVDYHGGLFHCPCSPCQKSLNEAMESDRRKALQSQMPKRKRGRPPKIKNLPMVYTISVHPCKTCPLGFLSELELKLHQIVSHPTPSITLIPVYPFPPQTSPLALIHPDKIKASTPSQSTPNEFESGYNTTRTVADLEQRVTGLENTTDQTLGMSEDEYLSDDLEVDLYSCRKCEETFPRFSDLRAHNKNVHGKFRMLLNANVLETSPNSSSEQGRYSNRIMPYRMGEKRSQVDSGNTNKFRKIASEC